MSRSLPQSSPRLLPSEYRLLTDLLHERAGLQFSDASGFILERRLGERVVELGLSSFAEYYKYLRYNPGGEQELSRALELVTTAETYFMRQEYQLRGLRDEVLPALAQQNADSRRLVLWSAGCSSGEEVYTLAILVVETGLFADWEVRIIGSDLSRNRVAFARRGVYRERSFRSTIPEFREAHFEPHADGWQVKPDLRALCHFGQLNLLDRAAVSAVGRVDVVFCRNVLIYFGVESRAVVTRHLYERLVPGGYLFLGHSESLLNVSTAFELVHLKEDLVYRRPLASRRWGKEDS